MIEITPLGDSALTVRFASAAARSPNDLLARVLAARRAIDDAAIPGVVETTTSYATVGVFLDMPAILDKKGPDGWDPFDRVTAAIREVLAKKGGKRVRGTPKRRVEVPICFESEFAPDLAELAQRHGLTPQSVIKEFCAGDFQVACVGFTHGFPYLTGLPTKLRTPRRETPRVTVPAGSVGIGNNQAGIYPIDSPGGWNLIGQTPLRLFDATREPASLLSAGDGVRFRAVSVEEFEKIRNESRR